MIARRYPLLITLIVILIGFALLSAIAHASTDPVADTRQIMAGTVTTKTTKNAYLSGARDGTAAFHGALAAYKAVRAAEIPPPPPAPPPPTTAKFAVGSNVAHCPGTAIFKVITVERSADADPAQRGNIYTVQFVSDPKGNFPANNAYWASRGFRLNESDLCAAAAPAMLMRSAGERG